MRFIRTALIVLIALAVFLFLIVSWTHAAEDDSALPIQTFGGLDTDNDPLVLRDNRTPDSQNVKTDDALGLSPREGYVIFSTESSKRQWAFPVSNGDRYLITQASNTLKATLGDSNFSITLGTVDATVPVAATPFGDKFYWYSSDGGKYWDTTVVRATNTAYDFDSLVVHKGRCWGVGVTNDPRNIYVSKYLSCGDFTLRASPTEEDPTRLQVQGSLDENLAGLYSSFAGGVVWSKASSFGLITGSKRSTFVSTELSDNVGSAYPESFQDCDGRLRFLGTRRSIWEYSAENGLLNLTNGKEHIDAIMQTVIQGDLNSRNALLTTANDWSQGTFGLYTSSTISSGDVVYHSTGTQDYFNDEEYTSNPTWLPGDTSQWSAAGGILNPADLNVPIYIFTGSQVAVGTWTVSGNLSVNSVGNDNMSNEFWFVAHSSKPEGYSSAIDGYVNSTGYHVRMDYQPTQGCAAVAGTAFSIFRDNGRTAGVPNETLISGPICWPNSPTPPNLLQISRNSVGRITITINGQPQTGSDALDTTFSSSNYIAFLANRNHQTTPTDLAVDYVLAIPATPEVFFSTYTTKSIRTSERISTWRNFVASDDPNKGTISYTMYTDTDTNTNLNVPTSYLEKQVIISNQQPTLSTAAYAVISASFTRTSSTQAQTISDITISWGEGSPLRPASLWFNQRYMLGVAISSVSNDITLVYDRKQEWQKWTIPMDAAVIYNSNAYFGNSGGIFQFGVGNDDNGAAITAYYKTKRFMPGGPNYSCTYKDFFITTSNNAESLQTQYYLNGVATALPMPSRMMNTVDGLQDYQIPFSVDMAKQGRSIEFLWTVSGTTNWRILAGTLYFKKDAVRTGN